MTWFGLSVTCLICLGAYIIILALEIRHNRYLAKLDALEEIDNMLWQANEEYNRQPVGPKPRHLKVVK